MKLVLTKVPANREKRIIGIYASLINEETTEEIIGEIIKHAKMVSACHLVG